MELLVFLISILLVLGAVLFLIFEIYAIIIGHLKGAPFVRSKKEKIQIMLELADIRSGEWVYDLGSGDGTLMMEAACRGANAVGIEINPFLCLYSRWRIRRLGIKNASIVRSDFRKISLARADVILLYLWPSTIEKLKEKLSQELKPGSRIISNGFPIKGWNHIMEKDNVYLYGRRSIGTQ
ncbi:MAG: class I SAM-dependent methyltransferase [Candidatus Sungbacteria bacterium]|nr:class I SAM-dependent methyltransferase [Candidatus Sungbacteria bacterium]